MKHRTKFAQLRRLLVLRIRRRRLFSHFSSTIFLTACLAGASCLNVVLMMIGGITALLAHCSGSWPTCRAFVANPFGCSLKLAISLLILFLEINSDFFLFLILREIQNLHLNHTGHGLCLLMNERVWRTLRYLYRWRTARVSGTGCSNGNFVLGRRLRGRTQNSPTGMNLRYNYRLLANSLEISQRARATGDSSMGTRTGTRNYNVGVNRLQKLLRIRGKSWKFQPVEETWSLGLSWGRKMREWEGESKYEFAENRWKPKGNSQKILLNMFSFYLQRYLWLNVPIELIIRRRSSWTLLICYNVLFLYLRIA